MMNDVMTKKYDYIIPLGRNCEVAVQLKRCFNFVETFPFNWMFIRNYKSFFEILKNDKIMFSKQLVHSRDSNMLYDEASGVNFHCHRSSSCFKGLTDEEYEKEKLIEIEELKGRMSYLLEKLHNIQSTNDKILYVITLPTMASESVFYDTPESVKEFAAELNSILSLTTKNYSLLIVIANYDEYYNTEIYPHVFVRSLKYFSPILRVSSVECSDFEGWNRIFEEFQPKQIKIENKKYKFSTDFSTIFFKEGYLLMYEDVAKDPIYSKNPMKHYKDIGEKEGRDNGLHPESKIFNAENYIKLYEDKHKRKLQVNPWVHYVLSLNSK